jgi:DNA repair protein RadC
MQEKIIDPLIAPTEPPRTKRGVSFHYRLIKCEAMALNDQVLDTPERAFDYWNQTVQRSQFYSADQECFCVLFLNTRRRVTGWNIASQGTLDTILVHPREVFRVALVTCAAAVILTHNHPSGDPTPSESDIKITRDLIRAGQLLKIDVLDHVIMAEPRPTPDATPAVARGWLSLREAGYFYT